MNSTCCGADGSGLSFGLWNVDHRHCATIPRFGASADVPGDVEFVARAGRVHGGREGPTERPAVLVLLERVQEPDHYLTVRFPVELDDWRVVAPPTAVCAGRVIEVSAACANAGGAETSDRLSWASALRAATTSAPRRNAARSAGGYQGK